MFTPHRKIWSLSPAGDDGGKSKGKAVAALSPSFNVSLEETGGSGGADDWRSFRDAGFLDKSELQRRDREALVARILEVDNELHEYQYNMGLLLIEKKEWTSKFEELTQGLATVEEILKREQAAHFIAVSEFEKREENMRKALGVEKQCVEDLEKALREMRAEIAEVKFTSDKKLTDAHALEATIEEKYVEIEGKLRSADAKLAEASRKSTGIDRKLEDVEARERRLERELLSLNTERKAHKKDLAEQREYLRDWENKLQEGQKRLVAGQRFLNEREDRSTETERVLKKKEEELEEARRAIEATKNALKDGEDDISTRLRALASRENDAKIKMENLAKKEKDLLALEENLIAKERVGVQKLLDDHNAVLNAEKREFEMEMEQKKKLFEEELKSKLDAVEKEKIGIVRKEEQTIKREQSLENKMEKMKIKERDLDSKSKALKKWEETIKDDEKKLKEEKKKLGEDMQELVASKAGLERLKAEIEAEKQQTTREKGTLKLTKEEREQHLLLQSKLKQEIEEYRKLKESLVMEFEALKQEREKFETEWEALDEKKMTLEAEKKHADDERQRFEKWRHNEEERLKSEGLEVKVNIQRELEDLRLKKEAFQSTMEHEQLEARDTFRRERADIARELELRKHELEMNIHKIQEDIEKRLRERETEFDRQREIKLNQIKSSSDLNELKIRKLKMEQDRLERQKEQLSSYGKKLEADQLEIQRDIDKLRMCSRNLKDQREEFVKERERFLAQASQCKVCKNCGVRVSELDPLGLQALAEIEDVGNVLLPSLADGFLEERMEGMNTEVSPQVTGSQPVNSGVRVSWLQKCSRLFNLSPGKKTDYSADGQAEKSISFGARLDRAASESEADYEPAPSYEFAEDSFETQRVQFDSGTRENVELERNKDGDAPEPSLEVPDNSVDVMWIQSDKGIREREDEHITPPVNEHNEMEGSSLPENDSQPQQLKQRRRQPSRRGRGVKTMKRTRSVQAVVEDAEAILGNPNVDTVDSLNVQEESQGDSVHASQLATSGRQKRRLDMMATSDLDAEDSEAPSESVSVGGRRKKRNVSAPGTQTPGAKRYNFRHSTITSSAVATQTPSDQTKGVKVGNHEQPHENEISRGDADVDVVGTSKHVLSVAPSSDFGGKRRETANRLQNFNVESTSEVQETSTQKIVQFETEEVRVELSEQSGADGAEVNGAEADVGTASEGEGYGSGSEDEDDGGYEDEEVSAVHNASIGKKILRFFTS